MIAMGASAVLAAGVWLQLYRPARLQQLRETIRRTIRPKPKAARLAKKAKDKKMKKAASSKAAVENEAARGGECVVCLDNTKTHAVLPCMHKCLCAACAEEMQNAAGGAMVCPICREPVASCRRVYE